MGIKQLYNDNLKKLPNEQYGDVSVMVRFIVKCINVIKLQHDSASVLIRIMHVLFWRIY